jgi:hypothetical protein
MSIFCLQLIETTKTFVISKKYSIYSSSMAQPTPRTVTDAIHSNCTLVVDNYQAETEEMQKSLSSKIIVEQVETAMDHRQKVSYMLIVDYVDYDEGRHKHTPSTNLRLH